MDKQELIDKIAGRRVVASISGGKDSAAMSLYLTELGIEHDRVFLDTGWEHAATYDYLRGPLTQKIGAIVEVRSPVPDVPLEALSTRVRAAIEGGSVMVARVIKKGMFPSKRRRFCTQELKVFPMQKYLRGRIEDGEDIINAVGIRAAESEARSKLREWEDSDAFDCEVWRPLIAWTEQDVIDIHRRHGLTPNPLYLQGASRVGCWPCIYARKSEIRHIAATDPERIALLRDLETDVEKLARARYEAKGDSRESSGYQAPAWFQAPLGGDGKPWLIDRVVEWSKTVHGGRQEDRQENLFAAMNDGCLRWGLCDTGENK